jgi:hypothetical protein
MGKGQQFVPATTGSGPKKVDKQTQKVGAPSNSDMIAMMESEKKLDEAGALRTAEEIGESGVLDTFKALENVEVPESERDRSIDDDAILVKQGLSKLTPEEIGNLKERAYNDPEVAATLDKAIEKKHYGSALHRQYGELIEELTGGVISAEEAMAMNPTGGLPGPAEKEIPFAKEIAPVLRHAMRHDATGFLMTHFGVGPGYGTKTTALGFDSSNPLAGQILGIIREVFDPSELPEGDEAAKSGRFAEKSDSEATEMESEQA